MATDERIEGKVAYTNGPSSIAINRGADHGVQIGMHFHIYRGININDPDTGEYIGTVEEWLSNGKVREVQPLFAVLFREWAFHYEIAIGNTVRQWVPPEKPCARAAKASPVVVVQLMPLRPISGKGC